MTADAVLDIARGLRCVTGEVSGPVDLVALAAPDGALWEREGAGFAARGAALTLPADPGLVHDALAAITTDGNGVPLALGSLPFVDAARGTLTVPETVVRRDRHGRVTVTAVGTAPEAQLPPCDPAHELSPDSFTLTSALRHEDWCERVERTVKAIRDGRFEKAVLAREVDVTANRPFVVSDVLNRLRTLYPSCTTFLVDGFLGASPELLLSRRSDRVASHPLAGTIPRSGDPDVDRRTADALMASAKDREEHAHVVDAVRDVLAPWCRELLVPDAPSIVPLRNVSHLGTRIDGRLVDPAPDALSLALALHPTPAVGGAPQAEALAHLAEVEGLDRGPWAGPVGWVDADGDGDWFVAIRSAEVAGDRARMIAGVGIVADSEPDAELAETQLKLQALLAALVRP